MTVPAHHHALWRSVIGLIAGVAMLTACNRAPAPAVVTQAAPPATAAPDAATTAPAVIAPAAAPPAAAAAPPAEPPAAVRPVIAPVKPAPRKPPSTAQRRPLVPVPVSEASDPYVAAGAPVVTEGGAMAAPVNAPPPVCRNCGVIAQIRTIQDAGQGTGVGAIVGGLAGLIVGNQIGDGNGTTIAKVAGAAGGAYLGNTVEKRARTKQHYEVLVNMEDGESRTVTLTQPPALSVGAAVRVVNGGLAAR